MGWLISAILGWVSNQNSNIIMGIAGVLFAATLILRYGFGLWWPFGIVLATIIGCLGVFASTTESGYHG